MTTKRFFECMTPKCVEYDSTMCEFEDGDILYLIDDGLSGAYGNGYVLSLEWYDNELQETWVGIALYVHSDRIDKVWSYESIEDDEYGFCGIESLELDEAEPTIFVPMYMDAPTEWRALLYACRQYF